jgi:hypothetical protein
MQLLLPRHNGLEVEVLLLRGGASAEARAGVGARAAVVPGFVLELLSVGKNRGGGEERGREGELVSKEASNEAIVARTESHLSCS